MVWKSKKNRRGGSRSTLPTNGNTVGARQLRSCLRVGPDHEKVGRVPGGQDSSSTPDHSNKSGRSILSIISGSGSSRSKDSPSSDGHIHSNASGASGNDSAISPRNSSCKSSQHSTVVSRTSPSAEDKSVRFGSISIREHERVVGDNPSCSTGPPLGIGWGHGDTRVMPLDDYEERRPYRRKRIVLTRPEREELLLTWGISFDDIIDSIRMNIRVKNQRRQTVTNLGKIERLEEAFESATRKIKRALLLRRRTGDMVRRLQEQAEVAKKIHSPSSSVEDEQNSDEKITEKRERTVNSEEEPDRNQLSLPDLRKKLPSESRLVRATSSLSDVDELHTTISGFSFGNSTSASAKEMERFYRELEMEMFGDMPLPDMVGETLEVPGLSIPEEERVYHDPPFSLSFKEPPSVTPSYVKVLDESKEFKGEVSRPYSSQMDEQSDPRVDPETNPPSSFHPENDVIEERDQVMLRGMDAPIRRVVNHPSDEDAAMLSSQMPTPPAGLIFHDDPVMDIRLGNAPLPHVRLSTSLDSADIEKVERHRANMARAYLSQTVTAMEQRYLHPSLAPPVPPTNHFGMTYYPADSLEADTGHIVSSDLHGNHKGNSSSSSSKRRSSRRSKRSKRRKDEPEIRHTPLFTKKSPTYWMEGHDEAEIGSGDCPPYRDPITISEDSAYEDGIRPSNPISVEPRLVFSSHQRFTSKLYDQM